MEFDFNALRENRKTVAQDIIHNLMTYGTLERPGSGYGTHGLKEHVVPMGNANYLRFLAYAEKHLYGNNHFLTEAALKKEGLSVKLGTKPLIIERWTVDASRKYHAFDLPLYPVENCTGPREILNAYQKQNLPQQAMPYTPSRDAVIHLLETAGVLPKDAPRDDEALYQGIRAYAAKRLPDTPTEQGCLIHLLLKSSGIYPDFEKNPLFNANGIQRLADAPDLLFSAFSAASKEMHAVEQELRTIEAQMAQEKESERSRITESYKERPFEKLRVVYSFSECSDEFTDREGDPLVPNGKEGLELRGEEAYRFLMQVNLADKKHLHTPGYEKTWFTVSYGDTEFREDRFDLGDLSFGNKKTVAEAMEAALTHSYRFFLQDEDARKSHLDSIWHFGSADRKNLPQYQSPEAFRQYLEKNLQKAQKTWEAFFKEEQVFLRDHPEYAAINQTDAHPYIAICKASQLDAWKTRGLVMDVLPHDALKDFVTFSPGPWETNQVLSAMTSQEDQYIRIVDSKENPPVCFSEHEELPPGLVAFTTKTSPDNERMWFNMDRTQEFPKNVLYAIPKDDIAKIRSLHDITLKSRTHAISDRLDAEDREESFHGLDAIQTFQRDVRRDEEKYDDAMEIRASLPGLAAKKELAVYCKDKRIFSCSYTEGSGMFAETAPHYLPEPLPKPYQEACEIVMRYRRDMYQEKYPDNQTSISQLESRESLPSVEENRKNLPKLLEEYHWKFREGKPKKTGRITDEWRTLATTYYTMYPFTDPAVDTVPKAILGTISEMAKDGYTEARIKSVLTNISSKRTPEALGILSSAEARQIIRKARKEREETKGPVKEASAAR